MNLNSVFARRRVKRGSCEEAGKKRNKKQGGQFTGPEGLELGAMKFHEEETENFDPRPGLGAMKFHEQRRGLAGRLLSLERAPAPASSVTGS